MSRATITTRPLEVTETGHYTELLYDDGQTDAILCCAAHGGYVEPWTTELALELATRLPEASCWSCLGYDAEKSPFDLWHPPSSSFNPDAYPLLGRIAERGFQTVLSIHGLADDAVIVGGRAEHETKRQLAEALSKAVSVSVETASGGPYGGVSADNFVNWLAADGQGIQLELGPTPRGEQADDIRSALEAWLAGHSG